jgi:translation initiation factor 2 subunit 2
LKFWISNNWCKGICLVKKLLKTSLCKRPELPTSFEEVLPWTADEATLIEAEKAKVCARRYSVVEHDIRLEGDPLPSYERMLDAIESLHSAGAGSVVRFPPPIMAVNGGRCKKTIWDNADKFMEAFVSHTPALDDAVPLEPHFKEFICQELSTTMSVKAEGQYQINCKLSEANITRLAGKYIGKYHTCKQCKALEVTLVKEERALKVVCSKCTAHSAVSA